MGSNSTNRLCFRISNINLFWLYVEGLRTEKTLFILFYPSRLDTYPGAWLESRQENLSGAGVNLDIFLHIFLSLIFPSQFIFPPSLPGQARAEDFCQGRGAKIWNCARSTRLFCPSLSKFCPPPPEEGEKGQQIWEGQYYPYLNFCYNNIRFSPLKKCVVPKLENL